MSRLLSDTHQITHSMNRDASANTLATRSFAELNHIPLHNNQKENQLRNVVQAGMCNGKRISIAALGCVFSWPTENSFQSTNSILQFPANSFPFWLKSNWPNFHQASKPETLSTMTELLNGLNFRSPPTERLHLQEGIKKNMVLVVMAKLGQRTWNDMPPQIPGNRQKYDWKDLNWDLLKWSHPSLFYFSLLPVSLLDLFWCWSLKFYIA